MDPKVETEGKTMHIIQQIGLQVVEILTLVFGILGVTFSLLLMYSPNLTKSISNVFNRYVDIDDKVSYLDKDIQIDSYFYSHNMLFGTCLVAGSVFSLIFFFFKLDISSFANIFFVSNQHLSTNEMIFSAVSWIGKVACFFGILVGTMLLFAPNKMRQIETKLNSWFETRHVFDKLDDSNRDLDTILFQRPMFFGAVGLIVSLFIIVLSILNLLS
ncbi:MAG: hypothetical protein PVG87_27120 [Desulfobacteraceae bacterium]